MLHPTPTGKNIFAPDNPSHTERKSMKTIHPISPSLFSIGLVALSFLALPTGSQAQTQTCYDTNIVKFWNPPNVDGGIDVKDSRQASSSRTTFSVLAPGPSR